MSITTDVQGALASIASENADLSVAVVIGAVEGTGLRVTSATGVSFGMMGDGGAAGNIVRVSVATFGTVPEIGDVVSVAGVRVFVTDARVTAGMMAIEYSATRPATDEALA